MNFTAFSPLNGFANLILAALKIDKQEPVVVRVRQPRHEFYAIDKSGSMCRTLPALVEDLKQKVRRLQVGDAVTFGWFSSSGEFGFPIKAFRIVDENSFNELDRLFDRHKEALNLTCFSDLLTEIEKILEETAVFGWRNSLIFFSDGWANDRSVGEEHRKCREIMKRLNGKFDLVLTVAYSDYADRDFLTEMATLAGGECISSSSLRDVSQIFNRFRARAEVTAPRLQIKLGELKPEFVFALDSGADTGGITTYQPDENNEIYFAPNNSKSDEYLYLILRNGNAEKFRDSRAGNLQNLLRAQMPAVESSHLIDAAFASAVVLSLNGKQDEGIEVLGYLGDRHLVEKLGQARTPTERGNAENEIRAAIFNPPFRWFAGFDFGCVPKPDAFCVLDFLKLVAADPEAKFFPCHKEFRYKRIGRKSIPRAGYPEFNPLEETASSLTELVFNEEFLNLSLKAENAGFVHLPEKIRVGADGKLSETGGTILERPASLEKLHPAFQHRNYALVKDGFLNIERLPIICSQATAQQLIAQRIFTNTAYYGDLIFGFVELSQIPVINKLIAENAPSAKDLADKVYADEYLSARLKVLKFLRNELDPKQEIVSKSQASPEEQKFLKALGFRSDGSYNPLSDPAPATDSYEATCFEIKIKGFSKLPSVPELRAKLQESKSLTPAMALMNVQLVAFSTSTEHFSVKDKILWIDGQTADLKRTQNNLRVEIAKPKFSMLLGHKWFTDVAPTSDEFEVKMPAAGGSGEATAKISISKKTVKI